VPAGGRLPATGLGLTAAAIGALALLGGLAVRRRTHA
jgi:LPXTG-motif cell wall-anchored protein